MSPCGAASAGKNIRRGLIPRALVFIDETWAKTNMTRMRDWRPPRQAARRQGSARPLEYADVFSPRCGRTRLPRPSCWMAPSTARPFPLPMSSRSFVPTFKRGDVVVMDNLGSHREPGNPQRHLYRCLTLGVSAPLKSPFSNPIEQVFAQLKTLLRKAGQLTAPGLSGKGIAFRCSNASIQPSALPTSGTLVCASI